MISEREKQEIAEVYLERGIEQGKKETAKRMLERGYEVSDIADLTGLTLDEIQAML